MAGVTARGALVLLSSATGARVRTLVPNGVIGDEISVSADGGTIFFSRRHGCVDDVESVDQFAGVAVRVIPGHVEERLGDSQRGAQFMGGVRCESLLFRDVRFESREHRVKVIGEFAELVFVAR